MGHSIRQMVRYMYCHFGVSPVNYSDSDSEYELIYGMFYSFQMKLLLSIAIIVVLVSTVSMYVSMFDDHVDIDYCSPEFFRFLCKDHQMHRAECRNGTMYCPIVPWTATAGGEIFCPIPNSHC